jgi:hypothetical protein
MLSIDRRGHLLLGDHPEIKTKIANLLEGSSALRAGAQWAASARWTHVPWPNSQ